MASLQAKHSRQCTLGRTWTPFKRRSVGMQCPQGPVYYVVVREGRKAYKHRAGRNRRDAERALRKIAVSVDEGVYRPQENVGFSDWADQWLVSLERKPSTVDSYRSTINLAKEAFANKRVRQPSPRGHHALQREHAAPGGPPRQLARSTSAYLARAFKLPIDIDTPLPTLCGSSTQRSSLDRNEKKRPTSRTTNSRVFSPNSTRGHIERCVSPPSRRGCGRGELLGLCWGDVDLQDAVIPGAPLIHRGHSRHTEESRAA